MNSGSRFSQFHPLVVIYQYIDLLRLREALSTSSAAAAAAPAGSSMASSSSSSPNQGTNQLDDHLMVVMATATEFMSLWYSEAYGRLLEQPPGTQAKHETETQDAVDKSTAILVALNTALEALHDAKESITCSVLETTLPSVLAAVTAWLQQRPSTAAEALEESSSYAVLWNECMLCFAQLLELFGTSDAESLASNAERIAKALKKTGKPLPLVSTAWLA
jgi:hypothetical protein